MIFRRSSFCYSPGILWVFHANTSFSWSIASGFLDTLLYFQEWSCQDLDGLVLIIPGSWVGLWRNSIWDTSISSPERDRFTIPSKSWRSKQNISHVWRTFGVAEGSYSYESYSFEMIKTCVDRNVFWCT